MEGKGRQEGFFAKVKGLGEQSKEWLLTTLNSIGDAVIATDEKGSVIFLNPVAQKLTGWQQDETSGKPLNQVFNIVNEQTGKKAEDPVARVIKTGAIAGLANHTILISKKGARIYIDDSAAPIKNSEGKVIGVILIFRDITEKRLIEKELVESETRFRTLFESASDGIIIVDRNTLEIKYVNPSLCKMLERSADELKKMTIKDIHPKDSLDQVMNEFGSLAREEKTLAQDIPCIKRNGEIIYVDINAARIIMEGKEYLEGVFRDITARKKAEGALKEAKAFTESALNSITDIFYSFDLRGKFLNWNKTFNRISGYSDQELLSKKPIDFFSGKDIKRITEAVERIYKEGASTVEANFVVKNGRQIPCEFTGSILKDGKGNIIGFSGTGRDITERKKAEEALRISERKYKMLYDSSSDAVMMLTPEKGFFSGNPSTIKMFACKDEKEFTSQGPADLSPKYQPDGKLSTIKAQEMMAIAMKKGTHFFEWTHKRINGEEFPATVLLTRMELEGKQVLQATVRDISEYKKVEKELKHIEWLLTKKPSGISYEPTYGNLVDLNRSRLILDSVGNKTLFDIVSDYLDLMETSGAVYEKNGDYALGIFSSGWCQFMDMASRQLCNTEDNRQALDSGLWGCHESCWREASKKSIETDQPVDIECFGGLRLFAVPIHAGGEIVGSINVGYGNPPTDQKKLEEIAKKCNVSIDKLREIAASYNPRPVFIIELAKNRLLTSARLIGEIVERKQAQTELTKKMHDLEVFHKAAVDRELKMIELKKRIKELENKLKG